MSGAFLVDGAFVFAIVHVDVRHTTTGHSADDGCANRMC